MSENRVTIEDVANAHARQAVRAQVKWTCVCRDCRAQRAIDDAELAQAARAAKPTPEVF